MATFFGTTLLDLPPSKGGVIPVIDTDGSVRAMAIPAAAAGLMEGGGIDTITEKTAGAGVTVDGVLLKDSGVVLATGSLQTPRSGVTGGITRGYGSTANEGMQEATIEETISFAGNAALYKELTYTFPVSTVFMSVQACIVSALTGGGTTVKVGIGPSSDPDAYGLSSALTKNIKIDTIPDAAAGQATTLVLRLNSCASNGAAGDTALTVGSVRVRICYRALVSLTDAA
jgi:hypothetical protein